jgi:hypothetical protein
MHIWIVTDLTRPCQFEEGQHRDPRVVVESEENPERLLLETKICKEDGFQKQQGMPPNHPRYYMGSGD